MALIYNASFDSTTRVLSLLDKVGNVISSCEVPSKAVDDITKPLTLRATQDGSTVKLKRASSPSGAFQTSRDGGNTWANYTLDTAITLNTGDEVSFRAKADRTAESDGSHYFYFEMTGKIEAWHNVMSMIRTKDFATYDTTISFAFTNLFNGCQSLTKAPILPATTLANDCYSLMFYRCPSLTKAPDLPATTLSHGCYWNMFRDCQSLKEVRISATTTATDALTTWLSGVSATGDFYCDPNATIFPTDSASGIPTGWTRHNIAPTVDDITKPLTFRTTQNGSTVSLKKSGSPIGSFQTSMDGGKTWTDYTIGTAIALNTDDEVSFRAKTNRTSKQSRYDNFYFEMTGKIEAWHNVMSLCRTNDFATYDTVLNSAFYNLFMGCTSLTKAPVLPATTLAGSCYEHMFESCQSLKEAPELPATRVPYACYRSMFSKCQSLAKAPELPATTLDDYCYAGMFGGCQSLKEVRISATKDGSFSIVHWLENVSATGDFYCDPNATIFPNGDSGIPRNWVRHDIADYPN